jgi:amidase
MSVTSPKRVTREQYQYAVGPDIQPVLEIDSGEEIILETLDCFSGVVTDSSQVFNSVAEVLAMVPGLNPVTGPVAVRHAEVGDVLAVHVMEIQVGRVNGKAITALFPDFGGLCNPYSIVQEIGPDTKVCDIRGDVIAFPLRSGRHIDLPVRPMIGTIWTAPAVERRMSYVYDAHNGGNIDCPELGPGYTIYLPVHVPGGMLSVGDIHACMGDSEITGVAMETAGDVHVRIDLIKAADARLLSCPQIECERTIGSVGCDFGRPLGDNVKIAFRDLVNRLHRFHGFDKMDAYELLGQVAEVRVHQTLDNWNAVFVKLDKRFLSGG